MGSDVAVILPVRNGERYLRLAISSILAQSAAKFELLIVDDGSTDETRAIAETFGRGDGRIRILAQPPLGLSAAVNSAMRETDAEIIVRMDADDVALSDRIELQAAFLRSHPRISVVGSWVRKIDTEGRSFGSSRAPSAQDLRPYLLKKNPLCHPSVAFRRKAILAAGGYDERFLSAQDLELWLRLTEHGAGFGIIPRHLLLYRKHAAQVTNSQQRFRTYIFSILAVLLHIFRCHGIEEPSFPTAASLDFGQLNARIAAVLGCPLSVEERNAVYYQAARLLRLYANQGGMAGFGATMRRRAVADGNLAFLIRAEVYRHI